VFYDYHQDRITCIKFTPDNSCIASGSDDKSINLFDFRSPSVIQHYDTESKVNDLSFHP